MASSWIRLGLCNLLSVWFSISLIILYFSHTLGHLRVFLELVWRVWHAWSFGARRQRNSRRVQEDIGINNYNGFCFQLLNFMYIFFTSFVMHGICMWFFGFDISLAWRMTGNYSRFPSLAISWIEIEFVGLFHHCIFGWVSCFL